MSDIPIMLWRSHYSLKSVLTLSEKQKDGGPASIICLSKKYDIERPVLIDTTMSGFIEFFKNSTAAKLRPVFGLRLTVVNDATKKTDESEKEESKIVIFIKNGISGAGYYDLIKIHNFANVTGFHKTPRIDYKTLKKLWTKNLQLGIPFYDNAVHLNLLNSHVCIPEYSGLGEPVVFMENNFLPIDSLISGALEKFNPEWERVNCQTCYYPDEDHFLSYLVYRCVQRRSTISKPELNGFGSKSFHPARHFC